MAVRMSWYGKEIGNDIERISLETIEEMAQSAASIAQEYAPVKTGALRDSIHTIPARYTPSGLTVGIQADVPYALIQEEGDGSTSYPGRHFMRKAMNEIFPSTIRRFTIKMKEHGY